MHSDRIRAPRACAARTASRIGSGVGTEESAAGIATRSASAARDRSCRTVSPNGPWVLTGPATGAHTAKSSTGSPSSERSVPQASCSTPSSKGSTPSETRTATLVIIRTSMPRGWQKIDAR